MSIEPRPLPVALVDGIAAVGSHSMRLYRGLRNSYRSELVDGSSTSGTDFTDCPAAALLHAQSSRGALVVIELAYDETDVVQRVHEASRPNRDAKRFIVRGRFDDHIVAIFQAKELRARLRHEGLRNARFATKARNLRAVIDDELRRRDLRSKLDLGSGSASRLISAEQPRVSSRER